MKFQLKEKIREIDQIIRERNFVEKILVFVPQFFLLGYHSIFLHFQELQSLFILRDQFHNRVV